MDMLVYKELVQIVDAIRRVQEIPSRVLNYEELANWALNSTEMAAKTALSDIRNLHTAWVKACDERDRIFKTSEKYVFEIQEHDRLLALIEFFAKNKNKKDFKDRIYKQLDKVTTKEDTFLRCCKIFMSNLDAEVLTFDYEDFLLHD